MRKRQSLQSVYSLEILKPENIKDTLHVVELLMCSKGAFITGADFLIDGGATALFREGV